MHPDILAVSLCREMGWTLDEFDAQPASFIELLAKVRSIESSQPHG